MDTRPLDDALMKTYEDFDIPVDQFIGDTNLTEAFVIAVRRETGDHDLDSQAIMRRLVNLRKTGRLPRLRRNYYGRTPSDN
jgi:hypothetical protein